MSSLAILGAVNAAQAADLPVRAPMPVKAAVVAPAPFNWTGFYIGIHGGGAWLDHKQQITGNGAGICGVAGTPDCAIDKAGGAFGGLAGYNLQSGRIVYGVEVDGTWLSLKGSKVIPGDLNFFADPLTINTKVSWLATVRGRLGITMSPTLLYVTGGAAFGGVKSGWVDLGSNVASAIDKTRVGWVAGGGIEHAFANNWLVRIEGLYHDLGKDSATVVGLGTTYNTTFRHRVTTVRGAVALRW
ncbi:MAG: outer membrane beta-barrel protein [Xanthobacteraceae bacterium]|nr:outer membrane beta-barrel protein [Xanthobacteraceae bacterium]